MTKRLTICLITFLCVCAIAYLIYKGYSKDWTGFGITLDSQGKIVPAKKLWDWLDLLIVPLFLALAVWFLDWSRKASERRVETDRQHQKTLDDYLTCMTELILKYQLVEENQSKTARDIARTRTMAALRSLDAERKSQLLQFLYESGLIGPDPIVQLNGADLSRAELDQAVLRKAELRGVHFKDASLKDSTMDGADLRGSDFSGADFTGASIKDANLTQANLTNAKVTKEQLNSANTKQAILPKKSR